MNPEGGTSGPVWAEEAAFNLFRNRLTEILYDVDELRSQSPYTVGVNDQQLTFINHLWAETHNIAKGLWHAEATRLFAFASGPNRSAMDCDFLSAFGVWRDYELSITLAKGGTVPDIEDYDQGMRRFWDEHLLVEVKGYWMAKVWDLRRDAFSREMARKLLTRTHNSEAVPSGGTVPFQPFAQFNGLSEPDYGPLSATDSSDMSM